MSDDPEEERRRQNLRDLEFFSQRVRPTVSDLLRTNELSWKNNKISLRADKSREFGRASHGLRTPASLADIYADSRHGAERSGLEDRRSAAMTARADVTWLLVAAVVASVLASWTNNISRIIEALVF